jgi:hypothetical protein
VSRSNKQLDRYESYALWWGKKPIAVFEKEVLMRARAKTVFLVLTVSVFLLAAAMPAAAQEKPTDTMQMVKEKLKADKKLLIADNMQLTEKEAKAFWPVYDNYQKELGKVNERLLKLIDDYGKNYDTMTDKKALELTNKYLELEAERVKQLRACIPRVVEAVGARKAARYMQLENKITAVVRYDLAAEIPLVK